MAVSPFCHDFLFKKNKNLAKTTDSHYIYPQAKALPVPHGGRIINNHYFKSAE
jgi:hypothetical protein